MPVPLERDSVSIEPQQPRKSATQQAPRIFLIEFVILTGRSGLGWEVDSGLIFSPFFCSFYVFFRFRFFSFPTF